MMSAGLQYSVRSFCLYCLCLVVGELVTGNKQYNILDLFFEVMHPDLFPLPSQLFVLKLPSDPCL